MISLLFETNFKNLKIIYFVISHCIKLTLKLLTFNHHQIQIPSQPISTIHIFKKLRALPIHTSKKLFECMSLNPTSPLIDWVGIKFLSLLILVKQISNNLERKIEPFGSAGWIKQYSLLNSSTTLLKPHRPL